MFNSFRESPLVDNPKTLRSLIKTIGGGSSPILSRKSSGSKKLDSDGPVTKRTNAKGRLNSLTKSEAVSKRSISCDSRLTRKRDSSTEATVDRKSRDRIEAGYILLSQV